MLVVDKAGVCAGAPGIACGVIRNNDLQPAMSELMAACLEVGQSDRWARSTVDGRPPSFISLPRGLSCGSR